MVGDIIKLPTNLTVFIIVTNSWEMLINTLKNDVI